MNTKIYPVKMTVRVTTKEHKEILRIAKKNKTSASRLLVEALLG